MANIKFSDFTVGNTEGDIDFVVGYKGASNIQISPTNLLASALGNYLPLAGNKIITGSYYHADNVKSMFGDGDDLQIYHSSTNSLIENSTGHLYIKNNAVDKDIIFEADNGSGGITEYFRLDGSSASSGTLYTQFPDNSNITFGSADDLQIKHDGTDSKITNTNGDLIIRNTADDKDIIFQSDDGSGGVATYFFLDGQNTRTEFLKDVKFPDNVKANFGTSVDLQIYHNAFDSVIENNVGDLYITNKQDDGDIIFRSDNGSGAFTEYFKLDGSSKRLDIADSIPLCFGAGDDLQIQHNGSTSYIQNFTGNLIIENNLDDGDIIFKSDDGSGGTETYFYLDGSGVLTRFDKRLRMSDAVGLQLGSSGNFEMYHLSGNTTMDNFTGNLTIRNSANDKDISFACDDGSGGAAEYFRVDGSSELVLFSKLIKMSDNVEIRLGDGNDLKLNHDGTDSFIRQTGSGDLYIKQEVADKDIVFQADDGSGGNAEYMRLDGSQVSIRMKRQVKWDDNIKATFGDSDDLEIYHSGASSSIRNQTGDLYIQNFADDSDIVFQSDDGSGGVTTYFKLDGGDSSANPLTIFPDNSRVGFGASGDLQIYHDGTDSYISDTGTGDLKILGADIEISTAGGNKYFSGAANVAKLYHTNNEKLATTSTGVKISGVSEYADNTAAIAGGLTTGDVYRTGDLLKIVH